MRSVDYQPQNHTSVAGFENGCEAHINANFKLLLIGCCNCVSDKIKHRNHGLVFFDNNIEGEGVIVTHEPDLYCKYIVHDIRMIHNICFVLLGNFISSGSLFHMMV